ncbi:MAG: hypothetical protein PHI63_05685 [Patescibacteria group bacterium]|nr:hypothetical protein [Patescibacteria group bacterium]
MTQRTHLNPRRFKRQRRLELQRSRKCFRESMQQRTDLYALTFYSGSDRQEAGKRLKSQRRGVPCWDTDAEHRLIVSRDCLRLFRGLRYRKARVITRRRLFARLQRILARYPGLKPHNGSEAPAYERILDYLRSTRYFLAAFCRRIQVTYLNTLAYARERGQLLFFTATTCG